MTHPGEVAVLDYGAGNLASVVRALETVGATVRVAARADEAVSAERLVLPGVGAFGDAMQEIRDRGFDRLVQAAVAEGKPFLGICVGFQVLFEEGLEFGRHRGLGLFAGRVERFSDAVVVPHVGWNQVELARGPLARDLPADPYFYFVHSYRAQGTEPADVAGWCEYEGRFPAMVARAGVWGVQFHPEKSQRAGLKLLANFMALEPAGARR